MNECKCDWECNRRTQLLESQENKIENMEHQIRLALTRIGTSFNSESIKVDLERALANSCQQTLNGEEKMKILINQETVVMKKETGELVLLIQDNRKTRHKWDIVIDCGDVIMRQKFNKGLCKDEVFNNLYEVIGSLK